jgi:hypothetical protein
MNDYVEDVTGLRIGGWVWGLWPVWTTAFCMLPIVWCTPTSWWHPWYVGFLALMPVFIFAIHWVIERRAARGDGGGAFTLEND